MADGSNTAKKQRGQPFVKGDKRINRKGRPKSFDALRALAQQIAHEETKEGDDSMTTTESILRKWATSSDPRLQMEFIAVDKGGRPNLLETDRLLNGLGDADKAALLQAIQGAGNMPSEAVVKGMA